MLQMSGLHIGNPLGLTGSRIDGLLQNYRRLNDTSDGRYTALSHGNPNEMTAPITSRISACFLFLKFQD